MIAKCEWCNKEFENASRRGPKRFCSIKCRNFHNSNQKKKLPQITKFCLNCGKLFTIPLWFSQQNFCSLSCSHKGQYNGRTVWTLEQENFLTKNFSEKGPQWCSEYLPHSYSSITNKAYRLNLKMKPGLKFKMLTEKISGLQQEFYQALEQAKIPFEKEFFIKPKFIVDAAIPAANLILQIDGCYWHGHNCRFKTLTERQTAQKKRDAAQDKYLIACGWTILRFWECKFRKNPSACLTQIKMVLMDQAIPANIGN